MVQVTGTKITIGLFSCIFISLLFYKGFLYSPSVFDLLLVAGMGILLGLQLRDI